jgi:ribosomal protein S18 acetylase RimI-like enzyme
MSTRLLSADEWRQLRDLRLAALKESPIAFLATYEDQAGWTERDWRADVSRGRWLVAGDPPYALLGATAEDDVPTSDRYLSYLWVEAAHRRQGLGERLVREMLDLLRLAGVERAWLWVLGENEAARRLYERLGFVSTGERQPLDKDPSRFEERMTMPLN